MILSLSTLGTATAFCTNLGVLAFDCFMMKHLFTGIFEAMERYFANMVVFPLLSLVYVLGGNEQHTNRKPRKKHFGLELLHSSYLPPFSIIFCVGLG
jgi:hypothetical protein